MARLGILGGGQLGLYLCEAARKLGLEVAIISEAADDAGLRCADQPIHAALDNRVALDQLIASCAVVTFDKEGIPDETLHYLSAAEAQGRVTIRPGADTLLMLKDKALQKTWLQEQGLPTLPFHILSGAALPEDCAEGPFAAGLVQKARRGGYDGRGVQILRHPEARQRLWDVPSIVEPYLPDCREVSVVTVRDHSGNVQTYPPVSMAFDPQLNSVTTVSMPAAISPGLEAAAVTLAEKVVTGLGGVGVFAIEMFITPEDQLLINEISPRVHNSGHVTLDACQVSQFEQHVRAVTGLPLVAIECKAPAVMRNILYTEAIRERCPDTPQVDTTAAGDASIYWYGKAPGTTGRKMGHINALGATVELASASAERALAGLSSKRSEKPSSKKDERAA